MAAIGHFGGMKVWLYVKKIKKFADMGDREGRFKWVAKIQKHY